MRIKLEKAWKIERDRCFGNACTPSDVLDVGAALVAQTNRNFEIELCFVHTGAIYFEGTDTTEDMLIE